MAFQEVSTQSCGSRLMSSIGGAGLGVLLFIVSFPLLFWNEGNAVANQKTLDAGATSVVSVPADNVDPANEGKLVHVTGEATTDETLTDSDFGVKAKKALRLSRKAEMYQYKEESHTETKKNLGGSETTVTTYTYPTGWYDSFQDSSAFHDSEYKGKNPSEMPFTNDKWQAQKVTLGAFELTKVLTGKINQSKELPVAESEGVKPPPGFKVEKGEITKGDSGAPEVGDMRITYQVVEPTTISVVDKQVGKSFQPFQVEGGNPQELLEVGQLDAKTMFKHATDANNTMLMILRVVFFLVMAVGIFLVMRPLAVLGDVVPFIGGMVGALLAVVAGLIAAGFSLITISIAWLYYRPLIGVPLLIAGVAAVGLVIYLAVRSRRRAPVASFGERPA